MDIPSRFLINMFLCFSFSLCLQVLVHWYGFHAARGESELAIMMSCCSNSCCQTSVKLLATFAFQCTTRVQEHRVAVAQDSGLHTRHAASLPIEQTSILQTTGYEQSSRNAFIRNSKCHTSPISCGKVETPIRRGGQFCCSFVIYFSICMPKIIKIKCGLTQLLQKGKGAIFLPHNVVLFTVASSMYFDLHICLILLPSLIRLFDCLLSATRL